jgi:signal transduction histidine kinase
MKISLRNQLTIWVGLAILIIVFSTIFITQEITVWSLENSYDESIQKRAYMVASIISSDITTDEESYIRVINDLARQELSFVSSQLRVVSPSGKSIIEFGKISSSTIQQLDQIILTPNLKEGLFITVASETEPFRSFTVSVSDPRNNTILAYVQVLESLNPVERTKQGLLFNGILIGIAGSTIAIFIGQFLIWRGFRPLYAIIGAIDKVDYSHLKSSIHEENSTAELEQLTKSLSAMWLRLDMAVSEKHKVIGNMSHDLRTPLTAIQGQMEVLLAQPDLPMETKESINKILHETKRLTRMVKNMLLNAQLESRPTLIWEEVNLKEIVDEVIGDIWVLAKGLELKIAADEKIIILGGRDLLIQMLMNVMDNAIKFTPRGGKIELNLSQDGHWAILKIADTGQGISNEDLPHVTEAFYSSGSKRKSTHEGARLGLAIVKQVIGLHKGHLDIQSRIGVGTWVTVRLPLKQ